MMQPQSDPRFLVILTFACDAVIGCVRQLNIMDEECGDGNYGTTLAHTASVIKIAIKVIQRIKTNVISMSDYFIYCREAIFQQRDLP